MFIVCDKASWKLISLLTLAILNDFSFL